MNKKDAKKSIRHYYCMWKNGKITAKQRDRWSEAIAWQYRQDLDGCDEFVDSMLQ